LNANFSTIAIETMNQNYTPDGLHPEDAIWKTKNFINELEKVQADYFSKLVHNLGLNKDGESWLFDYIYNSFGESEDFEDYLNDFKVKYIDLITGQE
jgi:hypothetical protein